MMKQSFYFLNIHGVEKGHLMGKHITFSFLTERNKVGFGIISVSFRTKQYEQFNSFTDFYNIWCIFYILSVFKGDVFNLLIIQSDGTYHMIVLAFSAKTPK